MALKFYDSPFHVTYDEAMASKMAMKMDFAIMLTKLIRQKGWTQTQAAERLALTQPRISDLMNGKIEKFTLDTMFDMLDTLGFRTAFRMESNDDSDLEKAQITIKKVSSCA